MNTLTISKVIELTYEIEGVSGYAFGKDKNLYNTKRGVMIRKVMNGRAIGYWIGRKFYSLNKLRPLLKRVEENKCPF